MLVIYMKFICTICAFFNLKTRKTHSFAQNFLEHLLLMMSYLVSIATNSHQTCVKMCLRDMPAATKNGRC